jgi:hypothetical protein
MYRKIKRKKQKGTSEMKQMNSKKSKMERKMERNGEFVRCLVISLSTLRS